MESQILPTESEIYQQQNPQNPQNYNSMSLYGPAPVNNIENQESNLDVNQTGETSAINNINKFSLDKVHNNYNYPLTENRNNGSSPIIFKEKVTIFNSFNPNMIHIDNQQRMGHIDNQQRMGNNIIYVNPNIEKEIKIKIIKDDPKPEPKEKKNKNDDTCRCIILIICCLTFFPIMVLYFLIILFCKSESDDRNN